MEGTAVQEAATPDAPKQKKMTMVVMSGDMDKLFGAFIIATGAAAMGMDVVMFFTFWGLRALKKTVRTGHDALRPDARRDVRRRHLQGQPLEVHHTGIT